MFGIRPPRSGRSKNCRAKVVCYLGFELVLALGVCEGSGSSTNAGEIVGFKGHPGTGGRDSGLPGRVWRPREVLGREDRQCLGVLSEACGCEVLRGHLRALQVLANDAGQ